MCCPQHVGEPGIRLSVAYVEWLRGTVPVVLVGEVHVVSSKYQVRILTHAQRVNLNAYDIYGSKWGRGWRRGPTPDSRLAV